MGRGVEGIEFEWLHNDELELVFGVAETLHSGVDLDVVGSIV